MGERETITHRRRGDDNSQEKERRGALLFCETQIAPFLSFSCSTSHLLPFSCNDLSPSSFLL
jgi:hypothetical protein